MDVLNFYIYKIENKINHKIYIGKTNNVKLRWNSHIACSNKKFPLLPIHRAIKKHGKENFTLEIIDEHSSEEVIFQREIFWIEYHKSNIIKFGDGYGYNLTDGGEGSAGHKMTEAGKEKLRKINLGKKHSTETKQKHSVHNTGENNNLSKLTEQIAGEIKGSKLTTKELEIIYNISRSVIQKIRSGKLWVHVNATITDEIVHKPSYDVSRKLTKELAKEIKYSKLKTKELVKIYKVSSSIIQRIRSGKIWKQV